MPKPDVESSVMTEVVTGFDHAIVGVADLEAARAAYERLGFNCCPRGRHIGWGTANYCIMFADDYLELLGIVDPSQFTNNLDTLLTEKGEGLLGLAFGCEDADAAYEALKDAGGQPPKDLKRLLELPKGTVEPRFRLVHVDPSATPGVSAFVCQHLTPQLMRQDDWLVHANGATSLHSLTVRVADRAAALETYARTFGPKVVEDDRVRIGAGCINFEEDAGPPGPLSLTVAVADLGRTRQYLSESGVTFIEAAGHLRVDPAEARGVDLRFVEK